MKRSNHIKQEINTEHLRKQKDLIDWIAVCNSRLSVAIITNKKKKLNNEFYYKFIYIKNIEMKDSNATTLIRVPKINIG